MKERKLVRERRNEERTLFQASSIPKGSSDGKRDTAKISQAEKRRKSKKRTGKKASVTQKKHYLQEWECLLTEGVQIHGCSPASEATLEAKEKATPWEGRVSTS